MMKINLKPVATESGCPITVCKPSRRYQGITLTSHKRTWTHDQVVSGVVHKEQKQSMKLVEAIDNYSWFKK